MKASGSRSGRKGTTTPSRRWLEAVPDTPAFIDTRGVLLEGPELFGDREGFVAVRVGGLLLVAFGRPGPEALERALRRADPAAELVATGEAGRHMKRLLGFAGTRAWMHTLSDPGVERQRASPRAVLLPSTAPIEHIPAEFRLEIEEIRERRPIGAVMKGVLPVSVCYPTLLTERYWDVSILTLDGHRRAGCASAAFLRVEREMRRQGLEPVWGADEDNTASLELARKLGFERVGELSLFELSPHED